MSPEEEHPDRSVTERKLWNERYRSGSHGSATAAVDLLQSWISRMATGGRALDVACGSGRNARFLCENGFEVDAVDLSDEALRLARERSGEHHRSIRWLQADLEDGYLPERPYDLIVVVRYVNRPLLRRLQRHLLPGGWLVCEQHLHFEGDVVGPRDPRFRMQPGELRQLLDELEVRFTHDGAFPTPEGRQIALAQIVAQAPSRRSSLSCTRLPPSTSSGSTTAGAGARGHDLS